VTRRFSRTLVVNDGDGGAVAHVCCGTCDHPLAANGTPWKPGAKLVASPVTGLGGDRWIAGERVVLRQFVCPNCGALLDTETALPEDPFLNDVLTR
jgi:acetone carboxylase gamma subunit